MAQATEKKRADAEQWQSLFEENRDGLAARLLEAAGSEKKMYAGVCRCGRRVEVAFPDVRAQTDAIKALHELGYGKPRAEGEGGGSIVLRRVVVAPDGVELGAAGG